MVTAAQAIFYPSPEPENRTQGNSASYLEETNPSCLVDQAGAVPLPRGELQPAQFMLRMQHGQAGPLPRHRLGLGCYLMRCCYACKISEVVP